MGIFSLSSSSSPSASAASVPARMIASGYTYVNRHPKCKMLSYVRTAVGIFTVLVIYSSAMSSLLSVTAFPIGIYLAIIGVPTCMLEFGAIMRMCCGTEGPLCKVFAIVLGFDRWQRGCLYVAFAVVCFLPSISTISGKMAGFFLLITGILYIAKSFQKKKVPTYVADLSAHSIP